jgi:hypothetical protein
MGDSARYDAATHTLQPDLTLFNGNTPLLFVDPADAATIYDTPNTNLNANFTSGTMYDGTGVNIGIVGVSDLTVADVQNYRLAFLGETSGTVNLPTMIIDGDDPGLNGGGWKRCWTTRFREGSRRRRRCISTPRRTAI